MCRTWEDLSGAGWRNSELDGTAGVKHCDFFERIADGGEENSARGSFGSAIPRKEGGVAFCWIDSPFCHKSSVGRFACAGVELPDPSRSAIVVCRGSVSERPKVQHSKCCVV